MTSSSSSISSAPSRSLGKDFVAGLLVFLVALPLGLGVAMASGFPPAAGVLTAIVGGVVINFLGGAQLTIKGPAVGLIVIAVAAVTELGRGDMVAGYRYALAIGVVAAVIQIALALLRAGSAAAMLPPAVAHGMLAAIGITVIAKQAHTALGVAPENQATLALLFEIPSSVVHARPEIALIGVVSLVIMFGLPLLRRRHEALERLSAPLVVLVVAVALGYAFDLEPAHFSRAASGAYLVHLPGALLDAIALPDFSRIGSLDSIKYIVMFALVGSIESTRSVIAVDTLAPSKRASNLDRDLLVVGVGNLLASAIGGLPMISELVRSKANLEAGATSRFANFVHGLLMLGCVALLPMVLQHIPLAALAAMLVYVGAQLAAPTERVLGWDQLVPFLVTLFATLVINPLIGVGVGLVLKIGLDLARGVPLATLWRGDLQVEPGEGELRLVFRHAATFSSLPSVQRAVERLPEDIARVIVDVRGVKLVDHTFLARVRQLSRQWPHAELVLVGLNDERPAATEPPR